MKKHLRISAILFSVLMVMSALSSCSLSSDGIEITQVTEPESTTLPDPVLLEMESLSLREKVGLLFAVTPESLGASAQKQSVNEGMKEFYSSYPAGTRCPFCR